MARVLNDKILEAVILGFVFGGILGLIAFVLIFVNTGVATVLAIFASMFIVSSTILFGTSLILKSIGKTIEQDGKK